MILDAGLYDEGGPSTEEADIDAQSFPSPVSFALAVGTMQQIAEAEKDLLEGLDRAGFTCTRALMGAASCGTTSREVEVTPSTLGARS